MMITPRSTDSTASSSSNDSCNVNNIFRTPKEYDITLKKKVGDVLEITPPPVVCLTRTEDGESIVEESFDLNSILLKRKSKKFLAQIKFRRTPLPLPTAPSTEYTRIFFTEPIFLTEDNESEVQAILDNPTNQRVHVRADWKEVDPTSSPTTDLVEAYIFSTEQVEKNTFFSPPRRPVALDAESLIIMVDFGDTWPEKQFATHRMLVSNLRSLFRSLATDRGAIHLINAPWEVKLLWNLVLRWQFLSLEVCFIAPVDESSAKGDALSGGTELRAVTKRIMHGGVLSDGYVSERIRL